MSRPPSPLMTSSIVTSVPEKRVRKAAFRLQESLQDRRRVTLRKLLKTLLEYKSSSGLEDEHFAELLEVVVSSYIENEVDSKVHEALALPLSRINRSLEFSKGDN